MAGGGASSNASRLRKRVEADTSPSSLKRARDGSAFAKCDECNKDVPVALISFHNCSLDAKIKMNLEAQVVEMPSEAKKKPATENKKRLRKAEPSSKKGKSAKDPNKPKRPATAFFVFMDDFRKSFKESNPDCKGSKVAKEGGEAWKALSDEEKKVYLDKAADLKAEYEKAMEEYNEVEDEQEADDTADKEVKEEADVEDESEVKEGAGVEDESEVKEDAGVEDEPEKEVKDEELEDDDA